jgi:NADPH:quinone reductase-like Zn-dependent oxidoreductase
MSFNEAACIGQAGLTALQGLTKYKKIQKGEKVLINGASGGVGLFALQIAKYLEAEVTAVCSESKTELVKSLGADYIIDYKKEDFTKNGNQYDYILACNGYHPLTDYKNSLTKNGYYVMAGGDMKQINEAMLYGYFYSENNGKTLTTIHENKNYKDLEILLNLYEEEKIKIIIDKVYDLKDVPQAISDMEKGNIKGKLVISVINEEEKIKIEEEKIDE